MNRVTIQPTKFVNIPSNSETFGIRVYDDYDQSYDNTWGTIPEDDLEIFRKVLTLSDQKIMAMMEHIQEIQMGVYIGTNWYPWEKIRPIFFPDGHEKEDHHE